MGERLDTGARRTGYVLDAVVNAVLLVLIHWWPTWRAAPFLTEATRDVLLPVTVMLVVNLVTSMAYLVADRPWFVASGRTVSGVVGLVATVRILQVFPFDFGTSNGWATWARIVLIVAVVGGAASVGVQLVTLRSVARDTGRR